MDIFQSHFERLPNGTLFYDKNMLEYCIKSTQESIRKITENKSLESEKINQIIKFHYKKRLSN